jgi:hypothetical protein
LPHHLVIGRDGADLIQGLIDDGFNHARIVIEDDAKQKPFRTMDEALAWIGAPAESVAEA